MRFSGRVRQVVSTCRASLRPRRASRRSAAADEPHVAACARERRDLSGAAECKRGIRTGSRAAPATHVGGRFVLHDRSVPIKPEERHCRQDVTQLPTWREGKFNRLHHRAPFGLARTPSRDLVLGERTAMHARRRVHPRLSTRRTYRGAGAPRNRRDLKQQRVLLGSRAHQVGHLRAPTTKKRIWDESSPYSQRGRRTRNGVIL